MRPNSLLADGPGHERSVHRWTAAELHRRLAEARLGAQLAAARHDAAGYWRARTETAGPRAQLEIGHHLRMASELAGRPEAPAAMATRDRAAPAVRLSAAGPAGHEASPDRHRLRRLGLVCSAGAIAAALAVLRPGAPDPLGSSV